MNNSIVDPTKQPTFGQYGQNFQLAVLALVIRDKVFANKIKVYLKSSYFDNKYTQWFCEQILQQLETYRTTPSFEDLKTLIETQTGKQSKIYLASLNSIEAADLSRIEYVESEAEKFCFTKFALEQLEEEKTKLLLGDFDGAKQTAFAKYKATDSSYKEADIKADFKQALSIDNVNPVPTLLPSINKLTKGGPGSGTLNVIMAQSNFGKCLAKGTEIIMADLTLKKVEEIKKGELVMGIDSTPRTILELGTGKEMMYEIQQSNGESYTVNESHILSLRRINQKYDKNKIINISVKEYLTKSSTWKECHKGFSVAIECSEQELSIDPYFLGLWLGDGNSTDCAITTADKQIKDYLFEFSKSINQVCRQDKQLGEAVTYHIVKDNNDPQLLSLSYELTKLDVTDNKHIPHNYINNSKENRLKLLAGLLDSDGHLDENQTRYEICQKKLELADQITFLARSLGFSVSVKDKEISLGIIVKECYIYGDIKQIPTKILRKQTNKEYEGQFNISTIKVIQKDIQQYYGFTLDGDAMFLLKDFTVTHNTMYLMAMARNAAALGKNVIYFSLETDYLQLMQRFIAGYTDIPQDLLKNNKELIEKQIGELKGSLKVIEFKSIHARVESLKSKVDELRSQGFFPDIIVVDGLNQVKSPKGINFSNSNDKFEYLAEELRDWSKELELPLYVAFQSNRGGFNVVVADEQNIGKAIEVYQVCDTMLMFTQTPEMLESNQCYVQLLKNRLGPKGLMLKLHYDPAFGKFEELECVSRAMLMDDSKKQTFNKGLDTISKRIKDSKGEIKFSS